MYALKRFPFVLFFALALVLSPAANFAAAQFDPPGQEPHHYSPAVAKEPGGGSPSAVNRPAGVTATGGPDWYGYTWDDGASYTWIDAVSGGTDAGLGSEEWGLSAGPIDLPFSFRFYEDVYDQVWVSPYGYLTFSEDYYSNRQQNPFPSIEQPNSVIAPFWTITALSNSGPAGRVFYKSGGTAPNRYFAVEWHDVAGGTESDPSGGDELYRFEAVLYESGDILFQYHTIETKDYRYWASIGIEDFYGQGLGYMDWGNYWERLPGSGKAVLFKHPAPAARVNVTPANFGEFGYPGGSIDFVIPIRNTGEVGADTYDLGSSLSWPASLYAQDGVTPLADTNSNGVIDTGPVPQGNVFKVVARVDVPADNPLGYSHFVELDVRSSLNPSQFKRVALTTSVPSSFAQAYTSSEDGAVSLYLAKPTGQALKKLSADGIYPNDLAIVEAPDNRFLAAWSDYRNVATEPEYVSVNEIYYALVDRYGEAVLPATQLTDFSGASYHSGDYEVAVAAAPNGYIGLAWYRYFYNSSNDTRNYNLYLAILNPSGGLVYGPKNITNNATWGTWSDPGVYSFYSPRIAATTDNRFVLSWETQLFDGNNYTNDISYAIYGADGSAIKAPTQLTNSSQSKRYFYQPSLSALAGNRVLIAYTADGLFYAVLDSSGNLVKPESGLSSMGYSADAVQVSGGNLLVAWTYWSGYSQIQYGVLSGSSYEMIHGPYFLTNPAGLSGDANVSVAPDGNGNAVLTWTEDDWNYAYNLYYAFVDSTGSVLTQPMIFRSSHDSRYSYIVTNYSGYGNTSYSWAPPEGSDLAISTNGERASGQPGGGAAVGIKLANHGAGVASGVVVTATLGAGLTYLGDSTEISPTFKGNQVVWNMPDLSFLEADNFGLYVGIPADASLGDTFTVQVTAACEGQEATPADNADSLVVMAARQVFLPVLIRR